MLEMLEDRRLLSLALPHIGLPLAMPSSATTVTVKAAPAQASTTADQRWMTTTASSEQLEIRLGNLAQQVAFADQVKSFGQRMVTDHSNSDAQLRQIASSESVTLPTTLSSKDQAAYDRLSQLKGPAFDKAYMTFMVSDHQNDISSFKGEARRTKDSQLKDFANAQIPILQDHLNLARQTRTAVTNLSKTDRSWIADAASSDMFEVQLGTAALALSTNSDVQAFATRMVQDHSTSLQQLQMIAQQLGVRLPTKLNSQNQSDYNRLTALSGTAFDQAYSSFMVGDHQNDIASFTQENTSTSNAELQTFTNQQLAVLQTHLSLAQTLDTTINGSPTA